MRGGSSDRVAGCGGGGGSCDWGLVASLLLHWVQRRQQDLELGRALHQDLTSGEVAKARNVLGTLVRAAQPLDPAARSDVLQAYLTLLWCFERIEAGRNIMRPGRPRRFLMDLIRWHVVEWNREIGNVKQLLSESGGGVDDEQSRHALANLARAL